MRKVLQFAAANCVKIHTGGGLVQLFILDFIHFVMTARRAVITKWIKSAFQVKSARKADFVSLPKQEWEYLISCLAAAV